MTHSNPGIRDEPAQRQARVDTARGAVERAVARIVLDAEGDDAFDMVPVFEGARSKVNMPKPRAALVAAFEVARQAEAAIVRHALRARGAGIGWAELADLLRVEHAEAAYERILGPAPAGSSRFDERYLYWSCSACRGRIIDRGPYNGHPDDCESGHALDCTRHIAEVAEHTREMDVGMGRRMTDLVPVQVVSEAGRIAGLAAAFVETRRSKHTRDAYRRDLGSWLAWCDEAGVGPLTARHAHVQAWLRVLDDQGEAQGTQARRLSTVSSWYRWLIREGEASVNPADLDSAERPKFREPGTAGVSLSAEQAGALLQAADDDGPRTGALVALWLFTGGRVSEIIDLDVEDMGLDGGAPVVDFVGKGRKNRRAACPPPLFERIDRYLAARPDVQPDRAPAIAAGARPRHPLIATRTGRRIDRGYAWRLLDRIARAAGLPHIAPHDARRTYITLSLAEPGVSLRDVQVDVGHARPDQTAAYDRRRRDPSRSPAHRLAARFGTRLDSSNIRTGNDQQEQGTIGP